MKNIDSTVLNEIVQTCPFGLMIVDSNHHIVNINPHGAALFEYLPEEMVGTDLAEYVVGNDDHGVQVHDFVVGNKTVMQGSTTHRRVYGLTKSQRHVGLAVKIKRLSNGLAYAVFHDVTEFATGDSLTNALSRDQFFVALNQLNCEYSLLFVDLNKFKWINDNMGHVTGDLVLKAVSKRIHNVLRDSDLFCRYGGDEFVIVIPGPKGSALTVKRKIKKMLKEPIRLQEHSLNISCSIGVATSCESKDIDELINIADQRMYKDKK